MPSEPGKPVVFISYSHKDEPDQPQPGEVRWLSEILPYLSSALKNSCPATYELWDDRQIAGGNKWRAEIEAKLGVTNPSPIATVIEPTFGSRDRSRVEAAQSKLGIENPSPGATPIEPRHGSGDRSRVAAIDSTITAGDR